MSKKLSILAIAVTLSVTGADSTWAQGRGPGPNRGLGQAVAGAAAHAAASQAANTATTQAAATRPAKIPATASQGRGQVDKALPRGNPQLGNVAAGWNRGPSGLRHSTGALGQGIAPSRPLPCQLKPTARGGSAPSRSETSESGRQVIYELSRNGMATSPSWKRPTGWKEVPWKTTSDKPRFEPVLPRTKRSIPR
jgi:hypothetical protein